MNEATLRAALGQFTGTTNHYLHWSGMRYTDGVQFIAKNVGAYWLLDLIASWQPTARKDAWLSEFQLWELFVRADRSATIVCSRDSEDAVFQQTIEFTDFPLDYLKLYLERGVLLLPSEH